jgi:outer membrane biogenesis lipoprotein LolB
MKKLVLVSAVVLLSGCSTFIDSYLMKYDSNEYQQISDIRTTASISKTQCDNPLISESNATVISNKTLAFVQFTQYQPHNDKVKAASIELDKMAQGLKDQYTKGTKVSPMFCKLKFSGIESSAETIQRVVGDKPR